VQKSVTFFNIKKINCSFEINCGIKNIFDAYQNDFDIGKNRDSNFIYGPSQTENYLYWFENRLIEIDNNKMKVSISQSGSPKDIFFSFFNKFCS